MTKGFLNDPDRYLDTYFSRFGPDVWFHGDWAYVDGDGFWFLRGRADDTIKVSGRRTGPAEVEAALIEHPAVSEAAAIGVPHEIKGEALVCFVVLNPAFEESEELRAALGQQVVAALGKTLRPDDVRFVDALPKTRSGKIVRGVIRRAFLRAGPRRPLERREPQRPHGRARVALGTPTGATADGRCEAAPARKGDGLEEQGDEPPTRGLEPPRDEPTDLVIRFTCSRDRPIRPRSVPRRSRRCPRTRSCR